jgi:hypothetical protein
MAERPDSASFDRCFNCLCRKIATTYTLIASQTPSSPLEKTQKVESDLHVFAFFPMREEPFVGNLPKVSACRRVRSMSAQGVDIRADPHGRLGNLVSRHHLALC